MSQHFLIWLMLLCFLFIFSNEATESLNGSWVYEKTLSMNRFCLRMMRGELIMNLLWIHRVVGDGSEYQSAGDLTLRY